MSPHIAHSGQCRHPYLDTERSAPKRDAVPIRIGYCRLGLVDRPNLCWVSIAVLDEQCLEPGAGLYSPCEVRPGDGGRGAGAQVRKERSDSDIANYDNSR